MVGILVGVALVTVRLMRCNGPIATGFILAGDRSRATHENDFGELGLSFGHRAIFAFLLPVVDDFRGFVQQFDAIDIINPMLCFQLVFQLFPGIIPGPKKVRCQRAGAFADNLVNG